MVVIKKRGGLSLENIPKPMKISSKFSFKKTIDILPPPPPPGVKVGRRKIKIPKPLRTKKELDIPIPLKEKGHEELPPPPPYIPFDVIHSKEKDKLLLKELRFREKKKQRGLKKELQVKGNEIRIKDKELNKEIGALSFALKKHTKTINKYEKLLSEDPEKLLKINNKKIDKIKQELKSEEEYKEHSKKIKIKIDSYNQLIKENRTNLKEEIRKLNDSYQGYLHKAEGIRKAIFAKLDSIEEFRKRKIEEGIEKEAILGKEEEPFIEREREKLEKLRKEELEKVEEEEFRLEEEEKLERKAKEFRLPELEELPKPEEELTEIEIPPKVEEIETERAKKEIAEAIEYLKTEKPGKIPKLKEDVIYVIDQMIDDARDALLNLNTQKAKYIYIEIIRIYNRLEEENKVRVYEVVKELYDERKSAEAMLNR